MKTAFIGHRQLFSPDIEERLLSAVETEIKNGCKEFTVGTHGEFDSLALYICRKLRHTYTDIKIEVVLTSLNEIKKDSEFDAPPYADVQTIMYDIEDVHFKQKIIISNRRMLDSCDTLICYVDTSVYKSGAKMALRYAEKRGLKIMNLFRKEDNLFFGMTKEETDTYMKDVFEKLNKK